MCVCVCVCGLVGGGGRGRWSGVGGRRAQRRNTQKATGAVNEGDKLCYNVPVFVVPLANGNVMARASLSTAKKCRARQQPGFATRST